MVFSEEQGGRRGIWDYAHSKMFIISLPYNVMAVLLATMGTSMAKPNWINLKNSVVGFGKAWIARLD